MLTSLGVPPDMSQFFMDWMKLTLGVVTAILVIIHCRVQEKRRDRLVIRRRGSAYLCM